MKIVFKCIIFLFLFFVQMQSFGQLSLDDIDLEQIKQRKIKKYIETQISENKILLSDIKPSCYSGKNLKSFSKNEMTFFLKGNFKDVWQGYISENPSYSWNARKVSFGVLLERFPNNILYNHDPMNGVNTGQVYFLNLKVLKGIYNLPVAFEIITMDTVERVIEFSYLEGNKSSGVQQIKFVEAGNQNTKIIHTSYFKSDSDFRDKWIYPYFHKKIVNDFHRNMRKLLDLKKSNRKIVRKE